MSRFSESRIHRFETLALTWHAGMRTRISAGTASEVDCRDHAIRIFGCRCRSNPPAAGRFRPAAGVPAHPQAFALSAESNGST
ncbi:hypothetical protein NTJ56_24205 [Burkholderia contaminans]|uniref:hypothetical protein n=1 Tax=Burkholderia contaminans TaxID=488447 RepID=UPI001CF32C94|nr:hypothetical protein [Burkholderia contaminans]MCA7914384.1 hypothetical protein [Burkholderia contaminans]MCA8098079.1 hypothetical protein [Burkholderia contaminans]UUX41520.1 hypothetical protein NTJ56_24205 [Burkholderia contaminans]